MKKLLPVVLLLVLSNIISAQIYIPSRTLGWGTHVTIPVMYTGELKGFKIQFYVEDNTTESLDLSNELYQYGWLPYPDIKTSTIVGVGNDVYFYDSEIARIGIYVNSQSKFKIAATIDDGKSIQLTMVQFDVLNIPFEMYGKQDYSRKEYFIGDPIVMWEMVGTVPTSNITRITSDLKGTGKPVSTEDVYYSMAATADQTYVAYWPVFCGNGCPTSTGKVVDATWQELPGGKYGLFGKEKINNADLTTTKASSVSGTSGWFKTVGNNIFIFDPKGIVNSPMLIAGKPIPITGTVNEGKILKISPVVTDIEKTTSILPSRFELNQNYPNPFNPSTVISYQLPAASNVTLKVYDILSREVVTLVNEEKQPGNYEVKFDASKLSSGIYLYKIQADEFVQTKKMILMK